MTFDKVYSEFQSTDISDLKERVPALAQAIFKHKEIDNLQHHVFTFIMGTIHGDNRFDKAEFELLKPLIPMKQDMTYEEALNNFNVAVFDDADVVLCRKNFKSFPEDVKDAITMVCLIFAGIDGKVDSKELEWIKAFAL